MTKFRRSHSIIIMAVFVLICLLNGLSVFAAEGSGIEIKYTRDTYAISGAEVCIYKVADDIDIEKTDAQNFLNTLKDEPYKKAVTDKDGYCRIDTEIGTYLVCQTDRKGAAAEYEIFNPYFVKVPSYSDGETLYMVETFPKTLPIHKEISKPEQPPEPEYSQPPSDTVQTSDNTAYMPLIGIVTVSILLIIATAKTKTR